MKRWMILVLLAFGVTLVAAAVFLSMGGADDAPRIGVEAPIPEDAAPPPGVSRFAEWNVVLHRDGILPIDGKTIYGSQTLRLRLTALDFGAGEGWEFEIPGLGVSEVVVPGSPVSLEITPHNYNIYRVYSRSGEVEHTTLLRVASPENK